MIHKYESGYIQWLAFYWVVEIIFESIIIFNYKTDVIIQAVKIYNSDYTKGRRDQDSCLEKCYKLTVSKDRIGVI